MRLTASASFHLQGCLRLLLGAEGSIARNQGDDASLQLARLPQATAGCTGLLLLHLRAYASLHLQGHLRLLLGILALHLKAHTPLHLRTMLQGARADRRVVGELVSEGAGSLAAAPAVSRHHHCSGGCRWCGAVLPGSGWRRRAPASSYLRGMLLLLAATHAPHSFPTLVQLTPHWRAL